MDLKSYLPDISDFPDVDYWEVHLETMRNSKINLKNGEIDILTEGEGTAGNVRILYNGGWGFSSFNTIKDIKEHINKAYEFSRSVGGGDADVKDVPRIEDSFMTEYEQFPLDVSIEDKLSDVKRFEAVLRDKENVKVSQVTYADLIRNVIFYNSEGSMLENERVNTTGILYIAGLAEGVPESINWGIRRNGGYEEFLTLEEAIPELFSNFDDLLKAENASGGVYNCILDPKIAGVFAHESFGHTSEADSIYKNPQLMEIMKLGNGLGSEAITIIDDGLKEPLSGGYIPYDDEGVKGGRTVLLERGVLTAHLHNRETAKLMDEDLTGNARALNSYFPPIVRMTNTFIEAGEISYDDLLKELGDGILVKGSRGGMGGENFTFSAEMGYYIEDGNITKPIKNFTLTGNLFETLKNIRYCSDNVELFSTSGGCGKREQMPLPVGFGGPYVMVENALIGGR